MMTTFSTNTVRLNSGAEMPLLGLGVYKATGEREVERAINWAVEAGYRLIDTASAYKNEDGVGRGIALDRDGNYARIQKAYECMTLGKGTQYTL